MILPCAGAGSRLGLECPKPLYELLPGLRMIDLTLRHLQQAGSEGLDFRVVTVVNPRTTAVFDYVKNNLNGCDVKMCFYNERYREWPGSVYSANSFFGDFNLVLLPDSLISLCPESHYSTGNGDCLLRMMWNGLCRNPVHFMVVPDRTFRLKKLGAVRVEKGKLEALGDKPDGDISEYNGFWTAYGFRRQYGQDLYFYQDATVAKVSPPFPLNRLGPPGAGFVHAYRDLGTWEDIADFRRQYPSRKAWFSEQEPG